MLIYARLSLTYTNLSTKNKNARDSCKSKQTLFYETRQEPGKPYF